MRWDRLVTDHLQTGFKVCDDHLQLGLQYVANLSAHYSIILSQAFTEFISTISYYLIYCHYSPWRAQTYSMHRITFENVQVLLFKVDVTRKSFCLDISYALQS